MYRVQTPVGPPSSQSISGEIAALGPVGPTYPHLYLFIMSVHALVLIYCVTPLAFNLLYISLEILWVCYLEFVANGGGNKRFPRMVSHRDELRRGVVDGGSNPAVSAAFRALQAWAQCPGCGGSPHSLGAWLAPRRTLPQPGGGWVVSHCCVPWWGCSTAGHGVAWHVLLWFGLA